MLSGGMKGKDLDPLLVFPYKKKGRRMKRWCRRVRARIQCKQPMPEDYDTESEDEDVSNLQYSIQCFTCPGSPTCI